jgi:hypothetical protein
VVVAAMAEAVREVAMAAPRPVVVSMPTGVPVPKVGKIAVMAVGIVESRVWSPAGCDGAAAADLPRPLVLPTPVATTRVWITAELKSETSGTSRNGWPSAAPFLQLAGGLLQQL